SEKTWKLGFTTGHGQKPRERSIAARNQTRVLQEAPRPNDALVCLKPRRCCVAMKQGVKASGCIAFERRKGSPSMWSIPPPLKSTFFRLRPKWMRGTGETGL